MGGTRGGSVGGTEVVKMAWEVVKGEWEVVKGAWEVFKVVL